MTRLVLPVLIFVLSNPGVVPCSITGTVTIVHFGFEGDGQGAVENVTVVTLVDLGMVKKVTFCGDQRTFFPINQNLKAKFTSGTLCSTLVSVAFFFPCQAVMGVSVRL